MKRLFAKLLVWSCASAGAPARELQEPMPASKVAATGPGTRVPAGTHPAHSRNNATCVLLAHLAPGCPHRRAKELRLPRRIAARGCCHRGEAGDSWWLGGRLPEVLGRLLGAGRMAPAACRLGTLLPRLAFGAWPCLPSLFVLAMPACWLSPLAGFFALRQRLAVGDSHCCCCLHLLLWPPSFARWRRRGWCCR